MTEQPDQNETEPLEIEDSDEYERDSTMIFPRRKANSLNRYSSISQQHTRWCGISNKIASIAVVFALVLVAIRLFAPDKIAIISGSRGNALNNRCWLKDATKSGEFVIFSHRSYHDNTQSYQPSCEESLMFLKNIGVNHIDLDLVLDDQGDYEDFPRLIVAHPMEFKRTSEYYSPCANTEFDSMMHMVKKVYGDDYFLSMEPKAAWGRTPSEFDDVALANFPSSILVHLLEGIQRHSMKGKCAAIVEINESQATSELNLEKSLLAKILQHCQLFRGIRLADKTPTSMGEYDMLMPTIEFHPSHPHNTNRKVIPKDLLGKSIFWVVDNQDDLQYAADLRPYGIVSNSPKSIVDIIQKNDWCEQK